MFHLVLLRQSHLLSCSGYFRKKSSQKECSQNSSEKVDEPIHLEQFVVCGRSKASDHAKLLSGRQGLHCNIIEIVPVLLSTILDDSLIDHALEVIWQRSSRVTPIVIVSSSLANAGFVSISADTPDGGQLKIDLVYITQSFPFKPIVCFSQQLLTIVLEAKNMQFRIKRYRTEHGLRSKKYIVSAERLGFVAKHAGDIIYSGECRRKWQIVFFV